MNDSIEPRSMQHSAKQMRIRRVARRAAIALSWAVVIAGYVSVFHSVYAKATHLPVIAALLAQAWYVLPFSALLGGLHGGEKKWMWALLFAVASFAALTFMILMLSWLRNTSMFH